MTLPDWLKHTKTTRLALARRLGVSPSYVTQLCKGELWPGRAVAARLFEVTGGKVTPTDLLSFEFSPPPSVPASETEVA